MSQYWERLFVWTARFFAWAVAAVPLAVVLAFVAAFIFSQRSSSSFELVSILFSQLLVTLLIAALGSAVGATLGMGCAIFSHELAYGSVARVVRWHAKFLAVMPAVVVGWFGVTMLVHYHAERPAWVLASVATIIAIVVLPDAYILTVRVVRAVPVELLEAAAALGANAAQTTSQVIMPGSVSRLVGIYAAVFSRALPEAVAASIIFIYAAQAGYLLSQFSVPAVLLAQGTALRVIDTSMPLAAILLLALTIATRVTASRRIGDLEWV